MFDFRYHALTLVAVFVALTVGLLLGVAIGDQGLVSSAERKLRESLRADVRGSRSEADDLSRQLAQRKRFEEEAYPAMVGGRLEGRRIGLLGFGRLPDRTVRLVRDGLDQTGGRLTSVSVIREPLDLNSIARRARGTRYERLAKNPGLARALGERIGTQYVRNGALLGRLRGTLFGASSGQTGGLDGVVIVRTAARRKGEAAAATAAFERGMVAGIADRDVPAVGVETTYTKPSQVEWFRGLNIASVDSVDRLSGQLALVLALAGADGAFGVKSTADALLPKAVGAPGGP